MVKSYFSSELFKCFDELCVRSSYRFDLPRFFDVRGGFVVSKTCLFDEQFSLIGGEIDSFLLVVERIDDADVTRVSSTSDVKSPIITFKRSLSVSVDNWSEGISDECGS
jgi:hypothetical protein